MTNTEFAEYIKSNREELGWTMKYVTELLGTDRATLPKWEKGLVGDRKIEKYKPFFDELFYKARLSPEELQQIELGEFLHNMRKSVKWSSEKMGEKLGVHSSTINRWEKGKSLNAVGDIYILELSIREVVKEELKSRRSNKVKI